jgi:hypothetical protein
VLFRIETSIALLSGGFFISDLNCSGGLGKPERHPQMIRFSPFLAYLVKDLYLVSPTRVFLDWGLALPEYGVVRLTS